MSLFLVGLRGSGKTTAGRRAAAILETRFIDADEAIEARAGQRIPELFRAGEASFRTLEREVLLDLLPREAQIVATGGGSVLDLAVRQALRRHGQVLWLDAPTAVLQQRLAGSNRPSLTARGLIEEVAAIRAEREALYREVADVKIETSGSSLEEVAHVIEHFWSVLPHHHLR